MNTKALFDSKNGTLSNTYLLDALKTVGAHECDILFIHTELNFGAPASGMKRKELLASLMETLDELKVGTLIFPAFTFSFCNKEAYDVQNSKTSMGVLNEYARQTGRGERTRDPLLSMYVIGKKYDLLQNLGISSLGKDSCYDRLHNCGKRTKFLFLGADMRDCFTYTHYVEAILGVPYRYERAFTGTVIDNGVEHPDCTALLYTSYANCVLNDVPVVYDEMLKRGQLMFAQYGDGSVCCFDESDGYNTCADLITADPYCLTDGKFNPDKKDDAYLKQGRVVSV